MRHCSQCRRNWDTRSEQCKCPDCDVLLVAGAAKQFHDGGKLKQLPGETIEQMMARHAGKHTVEYDEGERQMVIMALAKLSLANPGWDDALHRIALKMDNVKENGRPQMYDDIRLTTISPQLRRLKGE